MTAHIAGVKLNRRTLMGLLSSPLLPAYGAGLGASDYGHLDGIRIDPDSGETMLLLLIDRPLEDGLTKPRVRSKMQAYRQWVFVDQKLAQAFPGARPEKGIRLVLLHPQPKNSLGTSVLEQLVGYGRELQFQTSAQQLPQKK